jgi:hypothetical protein
MANDPNLEQNWSNKVEATGGEYRSCGTCRFSTYEAVEKCPQCDVKLQTETELRRHGSLMVALGGVLVVMMTGVIAGLAGLLFYQLVIKERKRVDAGELVFVVMVTIAFASGILAFGIGNMIAGRNQQKTGRRDRRTLKIAMWILGGSFLLLALLEFWID